MANKKAVTSILNNMRGYQQKLLLLATLPRDEFLQDFTNVESAKHLLQVSIQCCIDLALHVIADDGYRTPTDSYDSFVVLHEEDIIPDDMLPTLRQM